MCTKYHKGAIHVNNEIIHFKASYFSRDKIQIDRQQISALPGAT
jgi:hypothetical protein